jgi:cytochrome c peroxidase
MTANRLLTLAAVLFFGATLTAANSNPGRWSAAQLAELRSLSLSALEPLPPDPTNRVADDPRAARLGERLFFDTRLSANGKVSCGTCHQADRDFQDGTPLGRGVGTTAKRTMPIASTARSPFLFWDGRKDSLWAQALGPLESAVEHGGTRAQYAHVIAGQYRAEYQSLFGPLPDMSALPKEAGPAGSQAAIAAWLALTDQQRDAITAIFVNVGKAIAAFERRIEAGRARFDRYVDAVASHRPGNGILTSDEIAGLELFIGKAKCTQCHNGPLFTNNEFHNTGVPRWTELSIDDGRLTGAAEVLKDEFNCRSRWSDARQSCAELDYLVTGDHVLKRAYKVPSLRNVAGRRPYMHAGQLANLTDVLEHYNRAPNAPAGHTELKPLGLNTRELKQLRSFLHTLSGTVTVNGVPLGTAAQ